MRTPNRHTSFARRLLTLLPFIVSSLPLLANQPAEDAFVGERERMVERTIVARGVEDEGVLAAMRAVPRHEFVPVAARAQAYGDFPLPIGFGQTISQPFIVALMTEAAAVTPSDHVLEIGTGSGYQAAVLAELVEWVDSIEIIGALVERARNDLERLGYDNVTVHHGDGYFGLEQEAPFDAILVTAAPDHIPQPLVRQLKVGGRMVIPVGPVGSYQTLWRLVRVSEEQVQLENLGGVRFVPFTRDTR
ncbi:MAG: protein-L-isoaspartate(D-aspartate) O-methyltransferase [Truepera sp.]|nr:protein-L-isoaspartate(D-aspartate) O-methyltransferase [Truepera sp.]